MSGVIDMGLPFEEPALAGATNETCVKRKKATPAGPPFRECAAISR